MHSNSTHNNLPRQPQPSQCIILAMLTPRARGTNSRSIPTSLILTSLKTRLHIDSKTANRDEYSRIHVIPTSRVPPRPQQIQSTSAAETLSLLCHSSSLCRHVSSITTWPLTQPGTEAGLDFCWRWVWRTWIRRIPTICCEDKSPLDEKWIELTC